MAHDESRSALPRGHRRVRLELALLLGGAACIGRPPADAHGPWTTAQRIAALDFGRDTIEQRTEHRELLQRWMGNAISQPRTWTALPGHLREETSRAATLADELKRGVRHELLRHPDHLPPLLPSANEATQNLVESADGVARFLWPPQPLGEIDDYRHRTRFDDDHPEATVLQRLLRRLRL